MLIIRFILLFVKLGWLAVVVLGGDCVLSLKVFEGADCDCACDCLVLSKDV